MKYLAVLIAIILLSAIYPAKASINACDGHIDILNIVQINTQVLAIDVKLTTSGENLNLVGTLGVDVNVVVRHGNTLAFVGTCFANFNGIPGEIVTVHIDVGNANVLVNADVKVHLANLHIDLDLGLNIVLGQDMTCHLLNGVVQTVSSLIGTLLGTPNCIINVLSIQPLAGSKLQVSLQLQNNVLGGLSLDLNVDLLNRLGITAHICTQHVVFSGIRGEIAVCILDVSGAVNLLLDPEVNVQLSVSNIRVNLAINAIVAVSLPGLDNCLDGLLQILGLPRIFEISGSVLINDCFVNSGNSLSVFVQLDVSTAIGSGLDVDLNVMVFTNANILLRQLLPCTFLGTPGEVVEIVVDLTALDLSAQVFVFLELADLDIFANINLDLGSALLFSLENNNMCPLM
jgi:hypothetical protein